MFFYICSIIYSHKKLTIMTSGKLFNGCLIVLGIFVAIVFGLGYAFSSSESSTTEELFRMNARVQFKKTEQL